MKRIEPSWNKYSKVDLLLNVRGHEYSKNGYPTTVIIYSRYMSKHWEHNTLLDSMLVSISETTNKLKKL